MGTEADWLAQLNPQQRAAATAGDEPLLIIAGAGTGKTNTLAYRVAHLLRRGVDPSKVMLLTFTRRAAAEMIRRVQGILRGQAAAVGRITSGTFHAVGHRILRANASALGLPDSFTVIDRSDAEDLLDSVRSRLGLDKGDVRFPKKSTCLAIYSRCVNAGEPVEKAVKDKWPWALPFVESLRGLFKEFVAQRQNQNVLDYDDLLLYWHHAMEEEGFAGPLRERYTHVLVDEFQDTNALQAGILRRLRPDGRGLTVVGDDAQAIYSFRAASVNNIMDFPSLYPGTTVAKLEQNYRSVMPILETTNAVIAQCPRRYEKQLFSVRQSAQRPRLVNVTDEEHQSRYVIERLLHHRETGIPLRRQAVLFRTAHHSDALEVELTRQNIPFVKWGGLKFLEAAHVKDVMAVLRLAENGKDTICAMRVFQLVTGVGPAIAGRAAEHLAARGGSAHSLADFPVPAAADESWPKLVELLTRLQSRQGDAMPLPQQVAGVRLWYGPVLQRQYDNAEVRARDLEQLEMAAANFASRSQLLAELTLDPAAATQDLAGVPLRDEDFVVLSTIHSAKGCEWDCVYVLHAADGNIPSDMATGSGEEIEEERRLFYVALSRAKDHLEVIFPLRYYAKKHGTGDRHSYAQLTRFVPADVAVTFERVTAPVAAANGVPDNAGVSKVKSRIAGMF